MQSLSKTPRLSFLTPLLELITLDCLCPGSSFFPCMSKDRVCVHTFLFIRIGGEEFIVCFPTFPFHVVSQGYHFVSVRRLLCAF